MIDLVHLLKEAMVSELETKKFYENASLKAQSQAGKRLFKEFAEFEQNHYQRVKGIIDSITNKTETNKLYISQDDIIIKPELNGEFEPNKDEIVEVITLAIESEKKAQERYNKIAELLTDNKSKSIFKELSFKERNHQKILEEELYQLSNSGTIIWE